MVLMPSRAFIISHMRRVAVKSLGRTSGALKCLNWWGSRHPCPLSVGMRLPAVCQPGAHGLPAPRYIVSFLSGLNAQKLKSLKIVSEGQSHNYKQKELRSGFRPVLLKYLDLAFH